MSHSKKDRKLNALESCRDARKLWLSATTDSELERVEKMYRRALKARRNSDKPKPQKSGSKEPKMKRRRTGKETTVMELKKSEYKAAGEKLALLMCQSNRALKAKIGLASLGYTCRLSSSVLDYPIEMINNESLSHQQQNFPGKKNKNITPQSSPPCIICDNFLTDYQQQHLKDIFEDPESSYWVDHNYQIEPPSPYFSFVMPLNKDKSSLPPLKKMSSTSKNRKQDGFLDNLIQSILHLKPLRKKYPRLKKARYVEMWLHNRPHASGHQMHFDSDDEGRGGIRNPIISTIVYITAGCGGPSLVTNQRLGDDQLATHGWLCHPKEKRLVAFDGKVLHGVVPGKGVSPISDDSADNTSTDSNRNKRRVTLMLAFWDNIQIRHGGPKEPAIGAARPFPSKGQWLTELTKQMPESLSMPTDDTRQKTSDHACSTIEETAPIPLDCVYETLDGQPWTEGMGLPDYNKVFQGF